MPRRTLAYMLLGLVMLAIAGGGSFENWNSEPVEAQDDAKRARNTVGARETIGSDRIPLHVGCGDFAVRIVTLPLHQPALRRARLKVERHDSGHLATLVFIRSDVAGVRVDTVDGETIGHLARDDGEVYAPLVSILEKARRTALCHAIYYGGTWEKPFIGAWIDLPNPTKFTALALRVSR